MKSKRELDFKGELEEQAKRMMLYNRIPALKNGQPTDTYYITPDWPHHIYFWPGWDSHFHAIILSHLGLKDLAKEQIELALSFQRQDGWIPNMAYMGRSKFDLERLIFKDRLYHSNYSQPPVLAQAVEWTDEVDFTRKVLPKLIRLYTYFLEKQDPDTDGLISICHHCESGRDSDPTFDFLKERLRGHLKISGFLGRMILILKLGFSYKRVGWDIDKIWELGLFNVEDVAFNSIWVDGIKGLERLVEDTRVRGALRHLADRVEGAIYEKMWDEEDGIFYALDSQNRPIKRQTLANLFPIILPNIPENILDALVAHLTNPDEFWTQYPVPSCSKKDPAFDPVWTWKKGIWRGPTWINTNWFIIRGLCLQAERFHEKHYLDIAEEIVKRTYQMISLPCNRTDAGIDFRECYNPLTGQGYKAHNFGWSGLVVTFDRLISQTRKFL